MSAKAKALQTLYRIHKVSAAGLVAAVSDGVITAEEYQTITGEDYA